VCGQVGGGASVLRGVGEGEELLGELLGFWRELLEGVAGGIA
jgi:hypothetical protein